MSWNLLSENAGFFGAILGAVAGGAGSWAAVCQWIRQLRDNDKRQDLILENHAKELEQIKVTRRELVFRTDCDKEQEGCRKILCQKLEEMYKLMRDQVGQGIENAKGIATIQEHLRGLEKRYEDDRHRVEVLSKRHETLV